MLAGSFLYPDLVRQLRIMVSGCLACLVLVVCPSQLQAKDSLMISFLDSSPPVKDTEKELYKQIKDILRNAIKYEYEFRKYFTILEESSEALSEPDYTIEFEIYGPYTGYEWNIYCKWYTKDDPNKYECWNGLAQVVYTPFTDQSYDYNRETTEKENIECLAKYIQIRNTIKYDKSILHEIPSQGDYCFKKKNNFKIISLKDYDCIFKDDVLEDKIGIYLERIPEHMELYLNKFLEEHKYKIKLDSDNPYIGLYVSAWDEYKPNYLVIKIAFIPPEDILERINFIYKEELERESWYDIAECIIEDMKERLQNE